MAKYDVFILGGGPAGLTAGLYAARAGLKTAIISKDIGGTANSILLLENWPGFSGTGAELMKQFYSQVKNYDVDFIMQEIISIEKKNKKFIIKTQKQEIESRSLIIATGTERRKLNVSGEKELTGKGVSYCVTCDAFFFKNKIVSVIGGSDCAATSALALSDIAKKVYVLYRGEKLRCEDINSKRLENKKNVEIFYNSIVKKINGENKVSGIEFSEKTKKKELKVDGVFVEVGATPFTDFIKNLELKLEEGYIVVDKEMKTNVSGVFAAGDVVNSQVKQVVVSSAQGALAAHSAKNYLR